MFSGCHVITSNYKQESPYDAVMQTLSEEFAKVPDHRRANASYDLADILRSAFAMFSLKSPSLLSFKEQTKSESRNLQAIYHIGAIPLRYANRAALDPTDPPPLRALFPKLFATLSAAGLIKDYHDWRDHVIVSVDGVEHFSSTKIHCPHCTTRTRRDGTVSYHHAGLAAVVLHPAHEEVIPLDFEPLLNEDGTKKNDCERNAAKRRATQWHERYPALKIILVEDALSAHPPHMRQITSYGWRFVLNVKPSSHQSLEKQFAGRRARGQVRELRQTDPQGRQHDFASTSGLCLSESAPDLKVNHLLDEQTDQQGRVTRWSWITNLPLTARTVERVMRVGRGRWKIENETFHRLKNQGYHVEHNDGHGMQNLATVLAVLMFLAYTVDQMIQHCW